MRENGNVLHTDIAGIAQSVEQRTENPCVTSSNLVPGKHKVQNIYRSVACQRSRTCVQ